VLPDAKDGFRLKDCIAVASQGDLFAVSLLCGEPSFLALQSRGAILVLLFKRRDEIAQVIERMLTFPLARLGLLEDFLDCAAVLSSLVREAVD